MDRCHHGDGMHVVSMVITCCYGALLWAGARSEALASAQLELHGLQDMLDNLTGWMVEADGKMTETEATPIGTDKDTVERLLAYHEVCVCRLGS